MKPEVQLLGISIKTFGVTFALGFLGHVAQILGEHGAIGGLYESSDDPEGGCEFAA